MIKSKKQMFLVIALFTLVLIVGGVTYSFFNYTRTGAANTLKVGRISFISRQNETINLTNLFPIDPTETGVMDDTTKVGTVEIEVVGDTDYTDGIEYLISTVNSNISSNGKKVPISIDVTINSDLGTNNDDYFTARESKNASIYKRMSGNTIVGDQQLLVGYIKHNTTNGIVEGISGSITIKAYIDKNKIAISDTYDGLESDLMGTTSDWVGDRVVFTTEEWNALQSSGASFQIKVEANEGIWVDEPIYNKLRKNAVMDNISSTNVSASTGIDFSKISGDTDNDGVLDNGEGLYIRKGTENDAYPVIYYRGNVTNNNVYFAGKCWQIIRTTDTGGTKLIYNGENTGTADAPACENTEGTARQITLNIDGTDTNTFPFSGTDLYNSPAYNGFMYNSQVYSVTNGDYEIGSKFGNGVTYDGTNYTITDINDTLDENHHYTCGTSNTTTCSSIRYYYSYFTTNDNNYYMYFILNDGKKIEDIVRESLENGTTESNAKDKIETWYETNINSASNAKIEDTVYCNDRSIASLGGLNPNGGTLSNESSTQFQYSGYKRNGVDFNPSTRCLRPQDSFTKESSNGNGLLDYPVGLITIDEMSMAGGKIGTANSNFYLVTGVHYWSLSPHRLATVGSAYDIRVNSTGNLSSSNVGNTFGLRPVISLKTDTTITDGDGTSGSPFIVK